MLVSHFEPSAQKETVLERVLREYQELLEGVLRVLRWCRVMDPSSGEILSTPGPGISSKEWTEMYNACFSACRRQEEQQLYVDLCRMVVLFLQELSFAYNYCTPASFCTVEELQQSFFAAMESLGKRCSYLSRYWIPGNFGRHFEGFQVVLLGRDLAANLWRDHFVVLERSGDDEEPSVSFYGLEDTTRTTFLSAFAVNQRAPVLRESIAKIAEREAAARAHCLLFCCLKRAATAHEYVDPPIGAVPIPVMKYAVEHAGSLLVTLPYEPSSGPVVQTQNNEGGSKRTARCSSELHPPASKQARTDDGGMSSSQQLDAVLSINTEMNSDEREGLEDGGSADGTAAVGFSEGDQPVSPSEEAAVQDETQPEPSIFSFVI